MKDNIFIVWSGNISSALKVKALLERRGYGCIVGGNSDNSSEFASVGDTVLGQLKRCNQAIVIFGNRADGSVSGNLYFELGYALASYGMTKVHCVRREEEKIVYPSDFDNAFVQPIACAGDEDVFAEGIAAYFFSRQKMSVDVNKMELINNRYKMRDFIESHFSAQGSKCSDYELAQYILFYTQAAHMFGDGDKTLEEMKKCRDAYSSLFSDELASATAISISFFELLSAMKAREDSEFYVDRPAFRAFRDKNLAILEGIHADDIGTFNEWATVFVTQNMTYAYLLYAMCPDLSGDGVKKNMEHCREWAFKTLDSIQALETASPAVRNIDSKGLLSLFLAYAYRNLFVSSKYLGDKEGSLKWLEKTKRERTALKNNFELGSIDTKLYENFEMEYYLCLSEYLEYADELDLDEDDVEDYRDDIRAFVRAAGQKTEHSRYIEKISAKIK